MGRESGQGRPSVGFRLSEKRINSLSPPIVSTKALEELWEGFAMLIRLTPVTLKQICRWAAVVALTPLAAAAAAIHQENGEAAKPRVVITADPELDDNNTIIRAILYSSDVKFEGLIYVSSQFHWKGDGRGTTQYIADREYTRLGLCPCTSWRFSPDERFIDDIVDAYAKAYPNLKVHDSDYPSPEQLRSKIKWGNVDFDGDFSKDTDGSNLIRSLLLDAEPGPLYVTAQGGESTIARALKSIYDEYAKTPQWEAIREKVSRKLIVIPSGDQDGTERAYIRPNWPEVREFEFSGVDFGYGAQDRASADDKVGPFRGQIAQPPCEMLVVIQCWVLARRLSSPGLVRTLRMAPCQLFRLQKRARRNDPNSLKGMQCKQVRIAGHNVSRLSAYSERKKLVILRIAAGAYLHIDIDPLRLAGQDSEKTPHVFFIDVTTKLLPAQNIE